MKNRTLPYGYQCCNGITVLHPQESEIVKRICESYLNGQSLLTIATWLNEEQIEYMPGVIGWNKARLKRIIEDERYLGKEPYPAILVEETYTAMQQIKEKRNTQKDTDRKTDIFQIAVPVKCPNCGKRLIRRHDSRCKIQQRWICENKDCRLLIEVADSDLLETVSDILAGITPESIRVSEPSNNEPSIEVRQLNNDISRMLGAPQIDKDALRKKMMECISQKYKDLDEEAHTARKLQADFDRADSEDYKKTLNRTVSEIILYKPITEYRTKHWRYMSEFGVQSYPGEKTVNSYTLPEDRNVFSRVMEMHQRSIPANKFLMQYLSENFKYPNSLSAFLYATQLFQAEAIKYCVEHLRRHRGRCMGALYWQLNDIWPVASWASIDSCGRYKALQYYSKRFYEPVLISCREVGEMDVRSFINTERNIELVTTAELTVTNDTLNEVTGIVNWELRDNKANIIKCGEQSVTVPALSYVTLDNMDFNKTDPYTTYISYSYTVDGKVVSSGTTLFAAHKRFDFIEPNLRYEINGDEITVYADTYAKAVEIDSIDSDFILSDNYFDMNAGSKTVKIVEGTPKTIRLRSVYDIK